MDILEESRVMLDLAMHNLSKAGYDTEHFERTVSKIKAEQSGLKLSHQKRILAALSCATKPLNYLEIAELTGLSPNQVHRRMGELEKQGKVIVRHSHGGYSNYAIPTENFQNTANHIYLKKQFEKWKKQAEKYEKFLGTELVKEIKNK